MGTRDDQGNGCCIENPDRRGAIADWIDSPPSYSYDRFDVRSSMANKYEPPFLLRNVIIQFLNIQFLQNLAISLTTHGATLLTARAVRVESSLTSLSTVTWAFVPSRLSVSLWVRESSSMPCLNLQNRSNSGSFKTFSFLALRSQPRKTCGVKHARLYQDDM